MRQQFYASTAPALAGANGRYIEMDYQETQYYGDAILMMKKQWDAFSLNAALGASINDKTVNSTRYDSKTASLKYANVFNLANIIMNGSAGLDQKIDARRQLQSLFATAQLATTSLSILICRPVMTGPPHWLIHLMRKAGSSIPPWDFR